MEAPTPDLLPCHADGWDALRGTRSQRHLLRPIGGIVRFSFGVSGAGYVRSRYGVLVARVEPGARLFLSAGEHVLTLRDPSPTTHVSIVFTPD